MPTLILTPRFTEDSQAMWRAASELGWGVERLTSWRVPDELCSVTEPVLYLEALFGPTLAVSFGLQLLEPAVDWLPSLPERFRKRSIFLTTLVAARGLTDAAFIKPPNDKSFPAQIYCGHELPSGYDESMPVLVSEIVVWEKEFRCFVLDREPRTISVYLRRGDLQRGTEFAAADEELVDAEAMVRAVLADASVHVPRACVIDVGVIEGRGWAVVEQNAAWGAGIYGCDPKAVLEVLRHASVPLEMSSRPSTNV